MALDHLQQIRYDVDGPVATITLDRPDSMNAFTSRMVHEMLAILDETDADDAIRAVIITGAGRAFCAGADMSTGSDTFEKTSSHGDAPAADDRPAHDEDLRDRDGGGIVSLRMFQSLKPIIGAVNGAAAGVGATMLLPMDIRLASTTARFGFVFTRRGILPEAASGWFLPRVVGISQALEWAFLGDVFDAEEALRGGLIRSVHEPDALLDDARELALRLASNTSSVSVAMTRQLLWRMLGEDHPMMSHRIESAAVPQLGAMADAHEGVRSFFEKRPPEFTLGPSADMPAIYPWFDEPPFRVSDEPASSPE